MLPHSSHLLQPLNIGCFSVLKRAYSQLVENQMRVGINHINKLDFLTAYPESHTEAYKAETIQNSFAGAGLVPYNPDHVLSKLNIHLQTPTPPGSQGTTWSPKTPHTVIELQKQASSIKALLKRRSQSPPSPSNQMLDQILKGFQHAMHNTALIAKENSDLRAANEKQKKKRTQSKKQLHHEGGLSIQEARELISGPQQAIKALEAIPAKPTAGPSEPARRAPPRCSDCRELGHRRLQCPNQLDR